MWILAVSVLFTSLSANAKCPRLGRYADMKVSVDAPDMVIVDEISIVGPTHEVAFFGFQKHAEDEFERNYGKSKELKRQPGFYVLGERRSSDSRREPTQWEKTKDSIDESYARRHSAWANFVAPTELKVVNERKIYAQVYFYPGLTAETYRMKQCEQLELCLVASQEVPVWTTNPLELEVLNENNGQAHKANRPYYAKTIASLKTDLQCDN